MGVGVFSESVSFSLLTVSVWFLILCCGAAVQLVSRFFSELVVLDAAVALLCLLGGGEFVVFYVTILNYLPVCLYSWKVFLLSKECLVGYCY